MDGFGALPPPTTPSDRVYLFITWGIHPTSGQTTKIVQRKTTGHPFLELNTLTRAHGHGRMGAGRIENMRACAPKSERVSGAVERPLSGNTHNQTYVGLDINPAGLIEKLLSHDSCWMILC